MIVTRKATRGFHITIVKYKDYQDQDNYKSDKVVATKETSERHTVDTKSKERKKEEINIAWFENFYINYPKKKWKKKALDFFTRKIKTEGDFNELMQGVENYKLEHAQKKDLWQFVADRQQADTFLSKETRKEYLDLEQDDETTFNEYAERYPNDYEYAHKLVAKRWEDKYLEVKKQVMEKKKNILIKELVH